MLRDTFYIIPMFVCHSCGFISSFESKLAHYHDNSYNTILIAIEVDHLILENKGFLKIGYECELYLHGFIILTVLV